jgi:hypothetical protein
MALIYDFVPETSGASITRATVTSVTSTLVRVLADGEAGASELPCELLQTGGEAVVTLEPGDSVLVWRSAPDADTGVIMGRIGPSRSGPAESPTALAETASAPEELVIEATKSLTLRVGDGSITIREDGKILIKGNDLVSHARRTNRIRGGAVAIN